MHQTRSSGVIRGLLRGMRAYATLVLLIGALTWASINPARQLLAGETLGYTSAVGACTAAFAWLAVLWFLICLTLTLLARLPGAAGRLAHRMARSVTPTFVRHLIEATLGATLAIAATHAAHTSPATTTPPTAAAPAAPGGEHERPTATTNTSSSSTTPYAATIHYAAPRAATSATTSDRAAEQNITTTGTGSADAATTQRSATRTRTSTADTTTHPDTTHTAAPPTTQVTKPTARHSTTPTRTSTADTTAHPGTTRTAAPPATQVTKPTAWRSVASATPATYAAAEPAARRDTRGGTAPTAARSATDVTPASTAPVTDTTGPAARRDTTGVSTPTTARDASDATPTSTAPIADTADREALRARYASSGTTSIAGSRPNVGNVIDATSHGTVTAAHHGAEYASGTYRAGRNQAASTEEAVIPAPGPPWGTTLAASGAPPVCDLANGADVGGSEPSPDLPSPDRPAGKPPSHQHRTTADRRVVVVRPGDTLWDIAARSLPGQPTAADIAAAWPRWYAANRAVIGPDPNVIHPGQRLHAPMP